ncbi:hypothetical protein KTT_22920 [Tengunoibacter tsumagoiensis]|uniref:Adenylyltransferase AadA C-terminal domain-containing protein n=2 Tax=Tengunoibacter tsumagoiensis TaxID=2014871 RepID=A0A402A013_9CHLR|nr:hypothetical protein KTT_22920 [Tengunoibacter tsumagoiensis]
MRELDLSCVVPAARPIVEAAANVYLRHTEQWLIGLLIHGSAFKGGFIPGCSDIDLQIYLQSEAFTRYGQLPLEICSAIQRDLSHIDPSPFQYIQGYALSSQPRSQYVGPIPGAYHMLTGHLPVPEASEADVQRSARKKLASIDEHIAHYCRGLLEHGSGKLERQVRFLCTDLWPTLYQLLAIQEQDGLRIWGLPKPAAIALLRQESQLSQTASTFYQALHRYYPQATSIEDAIHVIEAGIAFFEQARLWWLEYNLCV